MTSFYSEEELQQLGFKSIGKNVKISRLTSIYSPETIEFGNNVRIDDFCILSGFITFGSNIHISPGVYLYGAQGIVFENFTGISGQSIIYSAIDDFSGNYLIGPIHPDNCTNVQGGLVKLEKFVQIGCNSVVFPNITLREGSVLGAMSMLKNNTEPWSIYAGIPAKRIKGRSNKLLNYKY